jgi:hypothetical protein
VEYLNISPICIPLFPNGGSPKGFQAFKLKIHTRGDVQEFTTDDKIPSGFYDRVCSSAPDRD